jgi:hypothetical protein
MNMKHVGDIKVKNESNGAINMLGVYHGDDVVVGTFSDQNAVSEVIGYKTFDGQIADQIDDHTFKIRNTGEILRKV